MFCTNESSQCSYLMTSPGGRPAVGNCHNRNSKREREQVLKTRRRGWFAQGRRLPTNATHSDGSSSLPPPCCGKGGACCWLNLTYLLFELCHSGHELWWFRALLPLTAASCPVSVSNKFHGKLNPMKSITLCDTWYFYPVNEGTRPEYIVAF